MDHYLLQLSNADVLLPFLIHITLANTLLNLQFWIARTRAAQIRYVPASSSIRPTTRALACPASCLPLAMGRTVYPNVLLILTVDRLHHAMLLLVPAHAIKAITRQPRLG